MSFRVVIPARLASTRLPAKVLRPVHGKPLIQWVWEAARAAQPSQVLIATDEEAVRRVCLGFGAQAVLTSPQHASGTDRIHEVAVAQGWPDDAVIVNLQGDEPLMPAALLQRVAQLLASDAAADWATVAVPIASREEWLNPNAVKVVCDAAGGALYFSRAPIPWPRQTTSGEDQAPAAGLALRHVGLYAYRVGALRRYAALPPGRLERCEMLEQLRALEAGFRIRVAIEPQAPPPGVDTEADLVTVAALLGTPRP